MKLAEALAERAALATRLSQLAQRAAQHARVQEGEPPVEDPTALLSEHDRVAERLADLITRINRTNLEATLADGARARHPHPGGQLAERTDLTPACSR